MQIPINNPLATYLHDQLAGADMAIDLLGVMKDRRKEEPPGQFADCRSSSIGTRCSTLLTPLVPGQIPQRGDLMAE